MKIIFSEISSLEEGVFVGQKHKDLGLSGKLTVFLRRWSSLTLRKECLMGPPLRKKPFDSYQSLQNYAKRLAF